VRLAPSATGALPTVLDLGVAGQSLYAGTERGLWRGGSSGWERVPELETERVEALAGGEGWLLARTPGAVVSLRGGAVERLPLAGPGRGVALWAGAAWFADAGRLWRWDHDGRQSIAAPVAVAAVGAFGGELLIETAHGRYRAGTDGSWEAWPVNASRLVATGDDRLPVLALWDDGAATLHDPAGRESVALRL
jgi:hypothetical protein